MYFESTLQCLGTNRVDSFLSLASSKVILEGEWQEDRRVGKVRGEKLQVVSMKQRYENIEANKASTARR